MSDRSSPATLVGLLAASVRRREEADWLVYADPERGTLRWSYRAGFDIARRLAGSLAKRGVRSGDRVAIVAGNRPEVYFAYLACWLAGVTACPIGVDLTAERKRGVLERSASRLVLAGDAALPELADLAAGLPRPPQLLPIGRGVSEAAGATPIAVQPRADDTPAFLVYTSGTTGDPKGVLLDHGNLRSNACATAGWHRFGAGDGLLTVLPIHHVNGAVVTGLTPFIAGGRTLLEPAFSPARFWRRLAEERAVAASLVPTLLEYLLMADEDLGGYDLSALRYLLCGAGPLRVDTVLRFERRFGVAVCHGFGMSEGTAYNSQFPMEMPAAERRDWYEKHGVPSVGCSLRCSELRVLRPDGSEAAPLERGEIAVRGPAVMRGYLDDPAANARAFRDGWFLSGDQGFFDADGSGRRHLFVSGRLKELIVRGGVNLNPLEIDEALAALPGVAFALAFAFPNRFYGEEVAAFVVPAEGATLSEAELLALVAERLPHPLRPKALLFGSEIPFTATGKPKRLALAERLAPQLAHLYEVQHRHVS